MSNNQNDNHQATGNKSTSKGANASRKPIFDQVREVIQNKDQIKEQVVQNVQLAGKIVEAQAKEFVKQTKKSKFFNENIIPLAESELADKAIDVLNTKLKLKDTSIMKQVEKIRKDIIDTKVKKAKTAKATSEPTSEKIENTENN